MRPLKFDLRFSIHKKYIYLVIFLWATFLQNNRENLYFLDYQEFPVPVKENEHQI